MAESIRFGTPARPLALAAATAALVTIGCGGNNRSFHNSLNTCFEEPLPEPRMPDYTNISTLKLRLKESGAIKGKPSSLRPKLERRVENGIVKITTPDGAGSGFIIRNGDEKLVVTAGHVTEDYDPEDIIIEDKRGRKTHPTGGCYIYEDDGEFRDFDERGSADYDVAVLRLKSQKIGSRALKLAKKYPRRGSWVMFENYQQDARAKSPVSYPGIIATNHHNSSSLRAITGLSFVKKRSRQNDYRIMAGASGGAVVDIKKGEVVGISVAGPLENTYHGCSFIDTLYDVKCPPKIKQGNETGFMPSTAYLTEVSLIKKAVKALNR